MPTEQEIVEAMRLLRGVGYRVESPLESKADGPRLHSCVACNRLAEKALLTPITGWSMGGTYQVTYYCCDHEHSAPDLGAEYVQLESPGGAFDMEEWLTQVR